MKQFKLKLALISLLSLILMSVNIKVDNSIKWLRANQIEKRALLRVTSNQNNNGDSIIIYQGQTAVLEGVFIKTVPHESSYTIDNTDTIKIYGTYEGTPVEVAYISDTIYTGLLPSVTYSAATLGKLDGTLYYLKIPEGKFSDGDAYQDFVFQLTTIK